MTRCLEILLPTLFVSLFCAPLQAAGLRTDFSQVILEDLEIGHTYSTKELAGLGLVVVNTGDEPTDLQIDVLEAQPNELKENFESIPDLSWIKLEKTEFKAIKPNESAQTDVFILIPNNEQYSGRKYQVFIFSHTIGKKIGVGLKSRLLFSTRKSLEP